jgi:hypothetical protein
VPFQPSNVTVAVTRSGATTAASSTSGTLNVRVDELKYHKRHSTAPLAVMRLHDAGNSAQGGTRSIVEDGVTVSTSAVSVSFLAET